jgi:glucosamine--fructose-6-phosphate aminotransferase (isomerizing)
MEADLMPETQYTWNEIVSQPQVWRSTLELFAASRPALERALARAEYEQIITIGCGSTHYLAQSAAATLAHCTGIPARALPSSELWTFTDTVPNVKTLLLAISRSGRTTETLWALERFREVRTGFTMAVTCYPESDLAGQVDFALFAPDAQEESVAQTRSFASMYVLTQALAAVIARDMTMLERLRHLPDALTSLTDRVGDVARQLGKDLDIEQFFFLGGGPFYGLGNEVMLKVKEMSLSRSEAFHPMEFRHGPMSMVTERTLVVGLHSDSGLAQERCVLEDMARLGARTLALVENAARAGYLTGSAGWRPDDVIELQSRLNEWERGPLYLPLLQRLAFHRAVAKGLDPDRPTHLQAVIEL